MGSSDIVIHIDETLADDHVLELERTLGDARGIYSACMHEKTRHLMVVDFDPGEVSPSSIVQTMRDRGLHAQMIGL